MSGESEEGSEGNATSAPSPSRSSWSFAFRDLDTEVLSDGLNESGDFDAANIINSRIVFDEPKHFIDSSRGNVGYLDSYLAKKESRRNRDNSTDYMIDAYANGGASASSSSSPSSQGSQGKRLTFESLYSSFDIPSSDPASTIPHYNEDLSVSMVDRLRLYYDQHMRLFKDPKDRDDTKVELFRTYLQHVTEGNDGSSKLGTDFLKQWFEHLIMAGHPQNIKVRGSSIPPGSMTAFLQSKDVNFEADSEDWFIEEYKKNKHQ